MLATSTPNTTTVRRLLVAALTVLLLATTAAISGAGSASATASLTSPTRSAVVAAAGLDRPLFARAAGRGLDDARRAAIDARAEVEAADAIDPAAVLPQPEAAPIDPYAATPRVVLGTLAVPAIGLEQPLFEGVTLTSINRGPSHWPGTAMPGELGNVVVAGHRTTYTKPFWALNELQPGDELVFTVDGAEFVYELERLEVVTPDAMHIVNQTREHRATLFACHPRGSARQRIVGHFLLRIDPPTDATGPTHR